MTADVTLGLADLLTLHQSFDSFRQTLSLLIQLDKFSQRADLKKKTEESDIVQIGRVGWTPKPCFWKE